MASLIVMTGQQEGDYYSLGQRTNVIGSDETELSNDAIITIGSTSLIFTLKNFTNRQDASSHYKKVGEKFKGTVPE